MDDKVDPVDSKGEQKETKGLIRKKIWDKMHKERLSPFPGPFGRIPNFIGTQQAANKLLEIPEFQSAKSVEVNPDKPLDAARALVLTQGKELYVPTPRLKGSLLKKLEKVDGHDIKRIVATWGMNNLGKSISLEDKIKIDLVIVGCVAVSKDGYRIGKGRGFADLEFAILKEMEAIDNDTTIIAVVHDVQVFDNLDDGLFKIFDVPVDYIVTPTEIIKTRLHLPKPIGIYWSLITQERLNDIEALQKLKVKHESEGLSVELKTDPDEKDLENNFYPYRSYFRKYNKKKNILNGTTTSTSTENTKANIEKKQIKKSELKTDSDNKKLGTLNSNKKNIRKKALLNGTTITSSTPENEDKDLENKQIKNENVTQNKRFSSRRFYKTKPKKSEQSDASATTSSGSKETGSQVVSENTKKEKENISPKSKKSKKKQNGYSLVVSNIQKGIRPRDVKNALIEKGVKPSAITWKGFRGICLLHYSKKNIEMNEIGEKLPLAIDNVIELIQDMTINPNPSHKLVVKVKEPITRIETLDVTSV